MFDVVVVGGGPAGLSAALMLGRCRRRVLLCDLGAPRNRRTTALHGYLTRDGVAPSEFTRVGRNELPAYGIEQRSVGVTDAQWNGGHYRVTLSDDRQEEASFLLIATGVIDDLQAIPGLDACYGRSVFHCPYCDGWEWRDRPIAALGHGSSAAGLALSLKTWSADVVLCTPGGRYPRVVRDRLVRNGIRIRTEPIASLEHDDGRLREIRFASGDPLPRDVMFFDRPASAIRSRHPPGLHAQHTRHGADWHAGDTNVPRVFVAGDASRDAQFVVVAAAEGVKAALAINKALQAEELR
jgi:thioredoxin reductase